MIVEVEKNILKDIEPYSVILHQVNCLGKMGAGLAAQLCKKFDGLWKDYHDYCMWFQEDFNGKSHRKDLLGTWHKFQPKDDLIICNAFGQEFIRTREGSCMTDYDAWAKIFRKLEMQTRFANKLQPNDKQWKIYAPYKLGCGLGGGDWEKMKTLIDDNFSASPVKFIICKY